MFFAHAVWTQRFKVGLPGKRSQRSFTATTLVAGLPRMQSASLLHEIDPKFGSIVLHAPGAVGSSLHTMSNVMPAAWSCEAQPRVADFADTKSSVSLISWPDMYITTIVF